MGSFSNLETLSSFKGNITDDKFDRLLEQTERKLRQESISKMIKKKIFKVLVETLQNVYHHQDDLKNQDDIYVNFSLKKDHFTYKDHITYIVSAGNHVRTSKVSVLRSFIDKVNSMSQNELKEYYRYCLSQDHLSDESGAGLGFVDIIRKSGEKITYSFKQVNKDYSYFCLQVKVSA
jgi:hypothetical protein